MNTQTHDALKVVFEETEFSISTGDAEIYLRDFAATDSHRIIRDTKSEIEKNTSRNQLAPYSKCMINGNFVIPDSRFEDCLASAFYIFKRNNLGVGNLPDDIAKTLAHIFNVSKSALTNGYDLDDGDTIIIHCDNWECLIN